MSFSVRSLLAATLTLAGLTASLFAQSTTKAPAKVPRGSISGRVTIKDKPAPGVIVGLRKGETYAPGEPFTRTTTDQDGAYQIANLAAGNYSITISAPAHVMSNSREAKIKSVLVGEDENVEGMNFALVRGGVITGRITDAEGNGVIRQQVAVFPAAALESGSQQRQPPFQVASGLTDDRGIYRIYGLASGRYKVAVGRADDQASYSPQARNTFYKQVFHPDASEPAKATVIEVAEGGEATGIDITLGPALQTFSISGQIIYSETSLPAANIRFGLQRMITQRFEPANLTGAANNRGEFVIENVLPGKYGVNLFANLSGGMRVEPITIEVSDHDVSGVVVRLDRGASVAGVVVLEKDDKVALQKLLQMQLRAFVMPKGTTPAIGSSAMSVIGPDGSFLLTGLAGGVMNMSVFPPGMPLEQKAFRIVRVERDGVATPRGLEIKDGEQLSGVRVIISYGTAIVRGSVKFENGTMPGLRISAMLRKPGESALSLPRATVDERGNFMFEGIAAGTYELQVTASNTQTSPRRPLIFKREINVLDGETVDVPVRFDLAEPPKP